MNSRDNPRRRQETHSVTEQAAEWLMELEDRGPPAETDFADWLRESPTHVQAYLRAVTLDTLLRNMDPERSLAIESPAAASVVRDIGGRTDKQPRRRWPVFAAAAAVGMFALGWLTLALTVGTWKTYSTEVGEQRSVSLADGSTLTLNTDSRVRVRFNGHERQLRLMSGEAIFRAQRDPQRPFSVISGNTVVRAVGTEFNVYRKEEQTLVTVIEGRVAVAGTLLDAGEGIRVDDDGRATAKAVMSIANATAWRQRRLIFIDEPLASIVHEFNRYNRAPKIHVQDGPAADRRYAMILDADDPQSLLAVLEGDARIKVEHRGGRVILLSRGGPQDVRASQGE